jgi:hypothetical protein
MYLAVILWIFVRSLLSWRRIHGNLAASILSNTPTFDSKIKDRLLLVLSDMKIILRAAVFLAPFPIVGCVVVCAIPTLFWRAGYGVLWSLLVIRVIGALFIFLGLRYLVVTELPFIKAFEARMRRVRLQEANRQEDAGQCELNMRNMISINSNEDTIPSIEVQIRNALMNSSKEAAEEEGTKTTERRKQAAAMNAVESEAMSSLLRGATHAHMHTVLSRCSRMHTLTHAYICTDFNSGGSTRRIVQNFVRYPLIRIRIY